MRSLFVLLLLFATLPASAEKVTFSKARFSVEMPADWKKGKGPDDGNILSYDAPDGGGTFSIYELAVAKDHRANLEGTLEERVKAIAKAKLKVTADVKGQKQDNVDGKPAVFAVIPVEATHAGEVIEFRYYLVLIDAKDAVIIMQAALPSPLPKKLQEAALGIIRSFREKDHK
jgi:hypothetical protein